MTLEKLKAWAKENGWQFVSEDKYKTLWCIRHLIMFYKSGVLKTYLIDKKGMVKELKGE